MIAAVNPLNPPAAPAPSADAAPDPVRFAPPLNSPTALLERLVGVHKLLQRSAARLEGCTFRAGLRDETGKGAGGAGLPPASEKFFASLQRLVVALEKEAERIDSGAEQIHGLF